jgi:hypothetical protein
MNEDHVPHQIDINHNTISWSKNGLCCFSIKSHAYEMPKRFNDTPNLFPFFPQYPKVLEEKKGVAFQKT